jgi:PsbN protein
MLYNTIYKIQYVRLLYNMETATILVIFVSSLLLGITTYSIYTAFGPAAKNLRDPFEEHED